MNKETGEPALPDTEWLSIRDYFAAKAMQGELASQHEGCQWNCVQKLAEYAYQIADAMLKERSK